MRVTLPTESRATFKIAEQRDGKVRTLNQTLWRFCVAYLKVLSCVTQSVTTPYPLESCLLAFPTFLVHFRTGSLWEVVNESLIQWCTCPRVSSNKSIFAFIWLQAVSGCLSLEGMWTEVQVHRELCVILEKQGKRKICLERKTKTKVQYFYLILQNAPK